MHPAKDALTALHGIRHAGALRIFDAISRLACFTVISAATAAPDPPRPAWQQARAALDRSFVTNEFRIFYTFEGGDALPEKGRSDSDADGVPDQIQNLARQLIVARQIYVDVMGLRHPFRSPRYLDRVRYFDVHVLKMKSRGSAGDAIVNYHRPTDPPEGVEVLTIDIDRDIGPRNLTPAHELFHEFQNGYTLFKNAWYTEGTARWAENAFRASPATSGAPPKIVPAPEKLFSMRYEADVFWNALALAADPMGSLEVPGPIKGARYVGDPKPIVEDDRHHGSAFIKVLFQALDHADDIASAEANLDPLDWPESQQRSPKNNHFIWEAVMSVCRAFDVKLHAECKPPIDAD